MVALRELGIAILSIVGLEVRRHRAPDGVLHGGSHLVVLWLRKGKLFGVKLV